jgi:hypothetical protein
LYLGDVLLSESDFGTDTGGLFASDREMVGKSELRKVDESQVATAALGPPLTKADGCVTLG